MKRIFVGALISMALLSLLFSGAMAFTKSFKVLVVSKEKTVLVNDVEVTSLVDFNHKIEKDKSIVSDTDPYVSYKGTLISGTIITKAANSKLDSALKTKELLTIKFVMASDKDHKILKTLTFTKSKILDKKIMKKDKKNNEITYSFMSGSMAEGTN